MGVVEIAGDDEVGSVPDATGLDLVFLLLPLLVGRCQTYLGSLSEVTLPGGVG